MPVTQTIYHRRRTPPQRIVVADDDVGMHTLIAVPLRSCGFDVVVASDGEAALATILSDGANGLVSDFQMPGLDGLMLCRVLRGLRAYAVLPIVVFTSVREDDPCLLPLREIKQVRILHKPLGLREITPALMEMIPSLNVPTVVCSAHQLPSAVDDADERRVLGTRCFRDTSTSSARGVASREITQSTLRSTPALSASAGHRRSPPKRVRA